MARRVIALDIDDVIAASTEALRLRVNERYNKDITAQSYNEVEADYWGYYERVWEAHGLGGLVDYDDMQQEMVVDQSHVPLLPGASFAIAELAKKYDILAVTARNPQWQQATVAWLNGHFGDLFKGVHFAGNKRLNSQKTKGELCKELGAELLIDDNVEHCRSAVEAGLESILFGDYGWQRSNKDGLINCVDWPEVLEWINARG